MTATPSPSETKARALFTRGSLDRPDEIVSVIRYAFDKAPFALNGCRVWDRRLGEGKIEGIERDLEGFPVLVFSTGRRSMNQILHNSLLKMEVKPLAE